jgi:MHS family shikimate/dehydroshikimate transporter-like MFS transporter
MEPSGIRTSRIAPGSNGRRATPQPGSGESRSRGASNITLIAAASLIGTTIEWYDFFLYGTAAALVFNRLFFPTFDPLAGTLAAFGTYAVGFFARPVGGIVIGHYGDRIGRKSMLALTLLIMGVATFAIGLLPTYEHIGSWAAVGLVIFRMAQGFGVGGEWGGAVLMAVEHAPPGARGFYGSWPQVGVPAGLVLATAVFTIVSRMPEPQFLAWGWRVPFLLSAVLVAVGLVIRLRLLETPAFVHLQAAEGEARQPIVEVLRRYPKQVLLAVGARIGENGAFYVYSVFVLTYATQHVKMPRQYVLSGITIGAALELVAIPFFGWLSDRVGRRPVYLLGAVATALWAFPLFLLLDTASLPLVCFALSVAFVLSHAAMYGPQAAFLAELFGTRVRYSGASLGAQLAAVLAGGTSPFVATLLLAHYGRVALSLYVIAMAVVTIVAVLVASETRELDIT